MQWGQGLLQHRARAFDGNASGYPLRSQRELLQPSIRSNKVVYMVWFLKDLPHTLQDMQVHLGWGKVVTTPLSVFDGINTGYSAAL